VDSPAPGLDSTRGAGARRPSYREHLQRLHGDASALQILVRPLFAGSLVELWRLWNPAYTYALRWFVHAPLRRWLPGPAARLLTFLVCGFALHDLPFLYLVAALRGTAWPWPFTTLLFALLGLEVELSRALGWSWGGWPPWARLGTNLLALSLAGVAAGSAVWALP
jgi:hypothetical protein